MTVATSYKVHTEFLPQRFKVYSYPVASQIADKICAMYERHRNTPPGRASTRYHDLYDVALMARELTVNAFDLRAALDTQCRVRNMSLPNHLTIPDESWKDQYPIKARNFGDEQWGVTELDEALRVAGLLINPVLNREFKESDRAWNYTALLWE